MMPTIDAAKPAPARWLTSMIHNRLLWSSTSRWRLRFPAILIVVSTMTGFTAVRATAAPPPRLQPIPNAAAMQRLLDGVEDEQNASTLKYGYFLRRGQQNPPIAEGLALARTSLPKQPVASRRWFALQSLVAYAEFYCGAGTPEAGVAAYDAVFTHAKESVSAGADGIVRQAINDFVSVVPSDFGVRHIDQQGARTAMVKALTAYFDQLEANTDSGADVPPAWNKAIDVADDDWKYAAIADEALQKHTGPPNIAMLLTAASIYAIHQPQSAVDILKQAVAALPQGEQSKAGASLQTAYSRLVDALIKNHEVDEAVETQRTLIKLTGKGYARLIMLQREQNDVASIDRTMSLLLQPATDEREILESATALWDSTGGDEKTRKEAQRRGSILLTGYLKSTRKREAEAELEARMQLGIALRNEGKLREAMEVLTIDKVAKEGWGTSAQTYSQDIMLMKAQINARLNEEGKTQ